MDSLKSPFSIDFYEKWLVDGRHGSMEYLKTHLPFKKNPALLLPEIQSVISVSQNYFPAVQPDQASAPARVALYAQNQDYHIWLKEKLKSLIAELTSLYPDQIFVPYVDSGPVLERDLAYQNGLGWFGKNTCLIHPVHGSLFFVAEILTSLKLPLQSLEPLPDFCGTCTRCMDICPTGALLEPRLMKADLCISYLTIESRTAPAVDLRKKIGDWFFGCDLCQTVCPWNQKIFRQKEIINEDVSTSLLLPLESSNKSELLTYFEFLLTASHKQIQKRHFGSPLSRAGAKGLKRNAMIVIANQHLTELKAYVEKTELPEEFEELRSWTLAQLN